MVEYYLYEGGLMMRDKTKRNKARRKLTAILMSVVLLGGVLSAKSPVEAKPTFTWGPLSTYWEVFNRDNNNEIVKTYSHNLGNMEIYNCFRAISIKEAISLGATEAYHLARNPDPLAYAAVIEAKNTAGVDLGYHIYCPIKVTDTVNKDGAKYVVDDDGYELKDNTGHAQGYYTDRGELSSLQIGYPIGEEIRNLKEEAKWAVKQKVFGIKGYIGHTKKPALNAAVGGNVYHTGNNEDDRYFIHMFTYPIKGVNPIDNVNSNFLYPSLVPLTPGLVKELRIEVINTAKSQNATGVRLYFSKIPSIMKKGETFKFTAKLTGKNVMQSPIKNTIEFVAMDDIRIKKIYCGGINDVCDSKFQSRSQSKKFFTQVFSKKGALIGYDGYDISKNDFLNFNGIIAPVGVCTDHTAGFWGEHITIQIEKLKK